MGPGVGQSPGGADVHRAFGALFDETAHDVDTRGSSARALACSRSSQVTSVTWLVAFAARRAALVRTTSDHS